MPKSMGVKKKKPMEKIKDPSPEYICPHCGELKKRSSFYMSSDPAVSIGVAFPCRDCAEKIARNYNPKNGKFGEVTLTSLKNALCYLDKPFIQVLYDASYNEVHDESLEQRKSNLWAAYIKNVQMRQYNAMRWRDGDFENSCSDDKQTEVLQDDRDIDPEVFSELEKNRRDVIRLIGYDPFDKEADEDKPLLYAQLIGYIDADGNNDDMTRVLDSIEIVRGYLQLQKLNDMSAKAFANLATSGQSGEIKNYMDTKKKVADVISQLAEQSCISMKHNKNASKGENTWTGKIKKLKELNLREAEVNGFDIGTCRGMRQVMDMSNESILRALRLDESEYSEIVANQRERIVKLQSEKDAYQEVSRILLRENLDLRDVLNENNLLDISNLHKLDELFSGFAERYQEDQADEIQDNNVVESDSDE